MASARPRSALGWEVSGGQEGRGEDGRGEEGAEDNRGEVVLYAVCVLIDTEWLLSRKERSTLTWGQDI